jgi:glycosyltransferase involved in cell wall biosynthesis
MHSAIDVVMPVMNRAMYTGKILDMIAANTQVPDHIYVIDNGSTDDTRYVLDRAKEVLPLTVIRNEENIGVNASWNLGLSLSESPYISFLNNDIVIPNCFFENVAETFWRYQEIGIVLPARAGSPTEASSCQLFGHFPHILKRAGGVAPYSTGIQGWAFSVRRELIAGDPIPRELVTFFGDVWWFLSVEKQGFLRGIMVDVPVYHHLGGISSISMHDPVEKEKSRIEHEIWERLAK